MSFLEGKEFDYETNSQKLLEKLEEVSKEEKYYESFKASLEAMDAELHNNEEKDLELHKDEIKDILENEIISRYYYQTGRIENSLAKDIRVQKAIEILNNSEEYNSILTTTAKK